MELRDLRQRLQEARPEMPPLAARATESQLPRSPYDSEYARLKNDLHRKLLDRIDLEVMSSLPEDRLRRDLKAMVETLLTETEVALNAQERRQMIQDIEHEMLGLGPLEPLLADPTVSDILVNTWRQVYVERAGRLVETEIRFASNQHLHKIIDKTV